MGLLTNRKKYYCLFFWLLIISKSALKIRESVNASMGGVVVLLFIFGKPDYINNGASYPDNRHNPPGQRSCSAATYFGQNHALILNRKGIYLTLLWFYIHYDSLWIWSR